MLITKHTSTTDTTAAKGRPLKYIVIHFTAGTHSRKGAAVNTCEWWKKPDTAASADFVVDDEMIVQYNPDVENRYCWHCGGAKYSGTKGGKMHGAVTNYNSIGIEICSSNSTGKTPIANDKSWYFTDAVLKNAHDLTCHLMETYGIDADHVVRHYDVTGKICPGIIGWNADSGSEGEWARFKASLKSENPAPVQTEESKPAEQTAQVEMIVRVVADVLNVRKGPGTGYAKVTTIKKGEAYTIVETNEAKTWGKLKSGAGWISLLYTEKIK